MIKTNKNTGRRLLRRLSVSAVTALCVIFLFSSCKTTKSDEIGVATQFGIAYAPLEIMKEQDLLEKRLPDVKINWQQFGGPTAIREAMVSGDTDFGFMGVAPVIIGIDNGMRWRYASALCENEVALVVNKADVSSVKDLTENDRVAVLSPACTQHVLLRLLAKRELGDAMAFENRIVSMTHPDAVNALLSGTEVTAHMSTPPYIQREEEGGARVIATGKELMGMDFTFISAVVMQDFYAANPEYCEAFFSALNEAIEYIHTHTDEAAVFLSGIYGITPEEFLEQAGENGEIYTTALRGIEEMSNVMYDTGFTKRVYTLDELVFEGAVY